jgi:hypothetical protein
MCTRPNDQLTPAQATLLLVLRVFALWNSHKLIVIPLSVFNVAQCVPPARYRAWC